MSKKYSNTTADYLSWDQNLNLIRRLFDDGEHKMSLLISLGSFWGLRISDLLRIKWDDILDKDEFKLVEKKTGKSRDIKINQQLQRHIKECYNKIAPHNSEDYIFTSQKGSVYSIQRINVIFKEIKQRYKIDINNFSTHTMRKTFGREVFGKAGTQAELALVKLSQLFNHSSTLITRRYLGIAKEELMQTYDVLSF
ncbi:tyrosine-type recombinase/integrase [Labilibacter marinus]|uniref:tyrosine-type recombinase/integrase n=1 Tax=Labilibacter marinus TaxID=1477105 RepID=UPI00082AC15F|nr:tyrosine-type recombinase/integrase [Labilibacter marinus]